jgi:hypothetical protein
MISRLACDRAAAHDPILRLLLIRGHRTSIRDSMWIDTRGGILNWRLLAAKLGADVSNEPNVRACIERVSASPALQAAWQA